MNTAPTPAAKPAAEPAAATTASSSADQGSDLFALLLGSMETAISGAKPATANDTSPIAPTDEPVAAEGDFSLLLSQLPGMDGVGQPPTPIAAEWRFQSELPAGTAARLPDLLQGLAGAPLPAPTQPMSLQSLAPQAVPFAMPTATLAAEVTAVAQAGVEALPISVAGMAQAGELAPRAALLASAMVRSLGERTVVTGTAAIQDAPAAATAPHVPSSADLELVLPPAAAPKLAQAFADGMAVRLNWLADQQIGRAEIQLHPAELGSIDVALEFEGKTVRAEFGSSNPEVRHLIESTLPRLRELLESHGLSLRDANVGAELGGQRGQGDAPREAGSPSLQPTRTEATNDGASPLRRPALHQGGLSEYA